MTSTGQIWVALRHQHHWMLMFGLVSTMSDWTIMTRGSGTQSEKEIQHLEHWKVIREKKKWQENDGRRFNERENKKQEETDQKKNKWDRERDRERERLCMDVCADCSVLAALSERSRKLNGLKSFIRQPRHGQLRSCLFKQLNQNAQSTCVTPPVTPTHTHTHTPHTHNRTTSCTCFHIQMNQNHTFSWPLSHAHTFPHTCLSGG